MVESAPLACEEMLELDDSLNLGVSSRGEGHRHAKMTESAWKALALRKRELEVKRAAFDVCEGLRFAVIGVDLHVFYDVL